jgi:flagella basal body P-ring formation protein FlgA
MGVAVGMATHERTMIMPIFVSMLPLLFAAQPVLEDLDALDARLAKVSEGSVAPLDRRLRLVRCPVSPTIQSAAKSGLEIACPSLGWRLRVPLGSGNSEAVSTHAVLVQRGESVQVAIIGDDFTVQYQAVATEAGRLGDIVRVKFVGSNRLIAATVAGNGKAQIID